MNAAVTLFCARGYDATAVADICSAANASKGAFYHHFPSKQNLFLHILYYWLDRIDAQLFTQRKPGETVPQSMMHMVEALGFVFREANGQLPMFMEFMVQASRDEAVWSATIAPYRRYQQQFAAMIAAGKEEGSIRSDVKPEIIAQSLISMAVGVLLQSVVDPSAADWERVMEKGVLMIVENIKRSEI